MRESDYLEDKPEYSEASNKVLDELWKCRKSREKSNNRHIFSARENILQRIWNAIVNETLYRQKEMKKRPNDQEFEGDIPEDLLNHFEQVKNEYAILDEAYVDGTIFEICKEYEKELKAIEDLRWILKPIAFEIISKDFDDFKKAINYCLYDLISLDGRQRFKIPCCS